MKPWTSSVGGCGPVFRTEACSSSVFHKCTRRACEQRAWARSAWVRVGSAGGADSVRNSCVWGSRPWLKDRSSNLFPTIDVREGRNDPQGRRGTTRHNPTRCSATTFGCAEHVREDNRSTHNEHEKGCRHGTKSDRRRKSRYDTSLGR